ncbi:MAG: hypothetical protein HYT94_05500 [Parcubacteria group bacterium]|nr:hypothetical protein [Parcubacteria group bacterium]
MPWETVGSEDSFGGVRRVFVNERGIIHDDAQESTVCSEDSWKDYSTPVTVDKNDVILEKGK